jgi:hypothetical protein
MKQTATRLPGLAAWAALLALALMPAAGAAADDGYVRRLEALALLQTLNAQLLSHDSATAVLQDWCDAHGPRDGARIAAQRVKGADPPPTEAARAALKLAPGQAVRYRRVRLTCAGKTLSEADNWYLPDRLTPDMSRTLDTTDTPFGVVARPLDFRRRTLSARLLSPPLPPGWEVSGARVAPPLGPLPAQVLQHAALLSTPAGEPIAFVVETYTGEALAMALPP